MASWTWRSLIALHTQIYMRMIIILFLLDGKPRACRSGGLLRPDNSGCPPLADRRNID
jgi:hypothetical protein